MNAYIGDPLLFMMNISDYDEQMVATLVADLQQNTSLSSDQILVLCAIAIVCSLAYKYASTFRGDSRCCTFICQHVDRIKNASSRNISQDEAMGGLDTSEKVTLESVDTDDFDFDPPTRPKLVRQRATMGE